MSYQKHEPKTTQTETPDGHPQTTYPWTIQANDREWTLTATRYHHEDGTMSDPFWRIHETSDGEHDGDVIITHYFDKTKRPTVGVNWPAKGTQDIATTLKFKQDISAAVQAATEAQYIIEHEAAQEAIHEAEQYTEWGDNPADR